jgi:urease accessory protein
VAAAAGLTPHDAALCTLHHLVGAVTTAAVRLAGFDPFEVHALAARLGPRLDALAATAAAQAHDAPAQLPATTSLLADILAEHHTTWEVRLFAS